MHQPVILRIRIILVDIPFPVRGGNHQGIAAARSAETEGGQMGIKLGFRPGGLQKFIHQGNIALIECIRILFLQHGLQLIFFRKEGAETHRHILYEGDLGFIPFQKIRKTGIQQHECG